MNQRNNRFIAVLTVLILMLSAIPVLGMSGIPDIRGHWAQEQIETWLQTGLASGYPDGAFHPNRIVTRAEFITFVNRAFDVSEGFGETTFSDVEYGAWFYDEVVAAVTVGYVTGYHDGTFRPDDPITRQEAAVVLVRLLELTAEGKDEFTDHNEIAPWAVDAVKIVAAAGIVAGYPDSTFKPQSPITRAETIVMLQNGLDLEKKVLVKNLLDKPGIYGPEEAIEIIYGDLIIGVSDVFLQNTIIAGDLIIDETVGDGTVTLDNVTIEGDTEVKGGGTDSVIFRDCTLLGTITVTKEKGQVRVLAEGITSVSRVVLQTGAIIVSSGDGIYERIELPKGLAKDAKIILTGNFSQVEVDTEGADIKVEAGSKVEDFVFTKNSTGTKLTMDKDSNIVSVKADAKVNINGKGSINSAEINSEGVTIEQEPDRIDWGEGVEPAPEIDKKKASSSPSIKVSDVNVDGIAAVGKELTADPQGATVRYQWQSSEKEDMDYVNIGGATSNTYIIAAEDVGRYIRVEIKGTGGYTGTKTSEAVGPVICVDRVDVVDGADGVTPIVTPQVGQGIEASITLSDGTLIYAHSIDERVTYEWHYSDSTDTILGTEGSYTVTAEDVGKTICVRVKVEDVGEASWEAPGMALFYWVPYEAETEVSDIELQSVIYDEQESCFFVLESITEFTFKDGDGKMKAILEGEKWKVVLLVLSDYRLDWLADPDIGYYEITGEIEALDQYGDTFELNVTKDCGFTVWQMGNYSVSGIAQITFSDGKASFRLTGSAYPRITNLTAEIDGVQYYKEVNTDDYDAIVGSLPGDDDSGLYTIESWAAFETAIGKCNLKWTEDAGQSVLDAEVIRIQAALALLEKVVDIDIEAYNTIVALIPENNDDGIYAADDWAAFETAIAECNLLLTASEGQMALDAEVIKIQAALDLLTEAR